MFLVIIQILLISLFLMTYIYSTLDIYQTTLFIFPHVVATWELFQIIGNYIP